MFAKVRWDAFFPPLQCDTVPVVLRKKKSDNIENHKDPKFPAIPADGEYGAG
jgi:hypothetical protein